MRDILITAIVLIGCLCTVKRPYIGVYLWSWLSYMNPHRLAYGFAYYAPFAYITAIVLLLSMAVSKETKKLPLNGLTTVWIMFILYMGITTLFAYFPEDAKKYFITVVKIQLIVFITMMLITDLDKLNKLLWVIVLSIGYYSVKGGIFTVITGGSFIVWGPGDSFIEDNNGLAIAVLMVVPIMLYLSHITTSHWIRKGLLVAIICSLFMVLGSQSRGALLSIVAVGLFYWSKSQSKLMSAIAITVVAGILFSFMPASWYTRMDTINHYQEDGSAMGRINAWYYAFNAANHRLLGMGMDSWSPETFAMYAPNPTDVHAAHSIYFSVLGDHGWIGLIMFLTIYGLTWVRLMSIVKVTSKNDNLKKYNFLAKMLQVSFIAYFVGGAFLSLSYFDLPWHLISFVVLIGEFIRQDTQADKPKEMATAAKVMRVG